jgi:hypothetical protein
LGVISVLFVPHFLCDTWSSGEKMEINLKPTF